MLTTSADYKTAIAATDREMRGYVEFNGDSTKIMRGCDGLISIVTTAQIADEERPMFGCACASICEMTFYNSGLPAGVSLANSYFDAYVGIVLEDTGSAPLGSIEPDTATVEYVWMGRFIIDTIDRSKLSTKVTAYDDFTKLNKPYVCNVAETPAGYPINQIVGDIRTQCNLFASSTPSAPMGYVPKIYECTCRQMYGWVMSYFSLGSNMMARGGNVQNNYYTTVWGAYTHKDDAGHTITDDTIYMGGLADSPTFTFNSVVTGTEDNPVSVGSGTGIVGENPYFDAARATLLYNNINGLTFTPMTIEWRGDPAIQQGDIMKVVTGGNTYYTYVQRIVSTFNGGFKQTFECYGDSEYHYDMSTSPTQAAIKTAVSNMAQEIQQEIETADNGVITKILDLDGSWKELVIANNQDLSAATSVWRWNINGLAHSTAYSGGTYNFAVDMNGRIIADVIQTGILQDAAGKNSWDLDTGALTITDGSIHINSGSDLTSKIVFDATNTPNNPGDFHLSIQPYMIYGSFTDPGGDVYFVEMDAEANWFEAGLSTSTLQLQNQLRSDMLLMQRYTKNPITITKQSELNHTHLYFYNGASNKYTTLLDPDSSGAGRIYLGDGTSNIKRTSLTNTGLEFANSSGTVTATYPATGLQKLTGAVDSTTATGCVFAVPPQTFSSASTQQAAAEALLKYICTNYPNKTSCTFVGNYITTANRRGYELYISSTSTVNANGIPQYASGFVYEASTTAMLYAINSTNYVVSVGYVATKNDVGNAKSDYVTSGHSVTFKKPNATNYGTILVFGFAQGVGGICLAIQITNSAIGQIKDLYSGSAFSSSYMSFSYSSGTLTITSTQAANSWVTIMGA